MRSRSARTSRRKPLAAPARRERSEKTHPEGDRQAYARLLGAIHRVQSLFIEETEPRLLFEELLVQLLALTRSEYGFIGELRVRADGQRYLLAHAITKIAWDDATRVFYEGKVLGSGQAVIANDPMRDLRSAGMPPGHPALHALLGLPLWRGSVLVGMVGLANRRRGYDRALVEYIEPLVTTCASIIEAHRNLRRRHEAERAREEDARVAAALAHVGQGLISSLDTPVLLERLCELTAEALDCDLAYTLLWRPESDGYAPVAASGVSREQREGLLEAHLPREALSSRAVPVEGPDVTTVPADVLPPALRPELAAGTWLGIALRRGREMIGLQLAARRPGASGLCSTDLRIAHGIGQIASMALANARLMEELARASRLKSEFVSTMSHELRTPLNVILGFAEMLTDSALNWETRSQLSAGIDRAGRQLLELIESTLEIGRLEAGRDEVHLETVHFPALWEELRVGAVVLPRSADVALEWQPDAPELLLVTDRRKLAAVVRNLVSNALKFTAQGWVHVEAKATGHALVIRVADTGIGISPAHQEMIFEMFCQGDGSDSRSHGGAGLGLYIVRRFVEQLNGTIGLHSEPGRGSTFTITLRLADEERGVCRAA